VSLLPGQSSR